MDKINKYFGPLINQRYLLKRAMTARPQLLLATILLFVGSVVELFGLYSLHPILFGLQQDRQGSALLRNNFLIDANTPIGFKILLIICFTSFLCRIILGLAGHIITSRSLKALQNDLSCSIFRNILQSMDVIEIERRKIGFFVSLAGDETARAVNIVHLILTSALALSVTALYCAAILYTSPKFFIVLSVIGALSLMIVFTGQGRAAKYGDMATELAKNAHTIFLDGITGFKSLRALHGTSFAIQKYNRENQAYMYTQAMIDIFSTMLKLFPLIIIFLSILVLILATDSLNLQKFLLSRSGEVLLITAFVMRILPSIGQVITCGARAAAEAKSSKNVLNWTGEEINAPKFIDLPSPDYSVDSFGLESVWFRYSNETPWVISDFSYRFSRGSAYAIVGKSGVGKSTLLDLISGLLVPNKGQIWTLRAGSETKSAASRKEILVLHQSPFLLTSSLAENVALDERANHDLQMRRNIETAMKESMLSDYVFSLANGIDYRIGYHGAGLSGGQKQRLSVARAFYQHRPIIIGDEITSALDSNTARQLVTNLKIFCKDRILILVTHDESLLGLFDEVIRL